MEDNADWPALGAELCDAVTHRRYMVTPTTGFQRLGNTLNFASKAWKKSPKNFQRLETTRVFTSKGWNTNAAGHKRGEQWQGAQFLCPHHSARIRNRFSGSCR